jgi:hypothetical protein
MFTFKNRKPIALVVKTPPEDLEFCDVCGGINARARTAAKIDCEACGGTGYQNPYQSIAVYASYRPGAQKRWNASSGAVDYFGECSIKLDYKYKNVLDHTEYIMMDGIDWKFQTLREPGEALGQHRIVLALTRK